MFASLHSVLGQQDPAAALSEGGIAWYAYPFYLWLIGSVGVIIYRNVRRVKAKRSGGAVDETSHPSDVDGHAGGSAGVAASGSPRPAERSPATPSGRPKLSALVMGTAGHQVTASPESGDLTPTQRLFQEELARRESIAGAPATDASTGEQTEPAAQRAGFFASAPAERAAPAEPAKPVADLLAGIQLPCELVPVMSTEGSFGPHRVAFSTSEHGPGTVGREVGDELERLGFTLQSTGETTLQATKEDQTLVVTLYPQAKTATEDGSRMFPHVPAGSVAVVFSS